MSKSFNPNDEELLSALERVQRAREASVHTPIPATSVGPEAYEAHMGLAGPTAEAAKDLDGMPTIEDSRLSGYVLRGRVVPNADIKRFIVEQTAAGVSLPAIVDAASATRFPSLFTIKAWLAQDQQFSDAFKLAREIRGERLGEQALEVALAAEEETVKSAKLKHEALSRHAARMNREFQDKQVIETQQDPIAVMPLAAAVERLKALMAIPAVAQRVSLPGLPMTLDAEPAVRRLGIVKEYEDPMDAATPLVLNNEPDINAPEEDDA